MKRTIFLIVWILWCLWPILLCGQIGMTGLGGMTGDVGMTSVTNAAATNQFFFAENFETGSTNVWTPSAAGFDTNYATAPLVGTYSMRVFGAAGLVDNTSPIAGADNLYGFFRIKIANEGAASSLAIAFARNDVLDEGKFRFHTDGTISAWNGTQSTSSGAVWSINTEYYCWMRWSKGTGANGQTDIYLSSNSTKPGSPTVTLNNGDSANQPDVIVVYGNADDDVKIDRIYLSTTDITTAP